VSEITAGVIAKDDRVFLGVLLVTQDKRVPRVLLVSSVLFSAESMLRDVKLKAVEATTVTARARSARDEARKLVSQAVTLKVVCSAPESDWSQSEEASGGVRERQRDLLEASLVVEEKEVKRLEKLIQDKCKLELIMT
jgi:hypothetical protein